VPQEGAVVGVPHGDQPAGAQNASHLGQGGDGIGDVLKNLMGVNHVEGGGLEVQPVDVADGELDLASAPAAGLGEHGRLPVHADDPARGHQRRQFGGERTRPAADVEQVEPGAQMRQQVGRRVGGRPPAVAP